MNAFSLRSVLSSSTPMHQFRGRIVCDASAIPSKKNSNLTRRQLLKQSLQITGLLVATDLLTLKKASAADDTSTEAAEEIPEIEEKLTSLPEEEQKAVEKELGTIEEEISTVDEKLAKGEETEEEANQEAGGIQAQIDAIKSILGF